MSNEATANQTKVNTPAQSVGMTPEQFQEFYRMNGVFSNQFLAMFTAQGLFRLMFGDQMTPETLTPKASLVILYDDMVKLRDVLNDVVAKYEQTTKPNANAFLENMKKQNAGANTQKN